MNTPVSHPEYSRFMTAPQTLSLLSEAKAALRPFNNDLASESTSFDGTVYYALDKKHTQSANTVLSLDAPAVASERLDFRHNTIDNHRIDLGATALGYSLNLRYPEFVQSRMNPTRHMTWAHPTFTREGLNGGIQLAFSVDSGDLPSNDALDTIWKHHADTIDEVINDIDALARSTESLGDSLELLPPATPNAYIVRWDIVNSTELATTKHYGALRSYQDTWQAALRQATTPLHSTLINEGDGQNIVIPFPLSVDPADFTDIRLFGTKTISPLIAQLEQQHAQIARLYPDLHPRIRLAIGLGHLEADAQGKFTGPAMWEVGSLMKRSGETPLTYTDLAKLALASK